MRRFLFALGATATASLGGIPYAAAHHADLAVGGNGAGIITMSAEPLEEDHVGISLVTQFAGFSNVNFQALKPGEDTHQIKSLINTSLGIAYGVTPDFTVALSLPWIRRHSVVDGHVHEEGESPHIEALGNSQGLGDLTLLGQWRFLYQQDWGLQLAVVAGVKLPTGRTNARGRSGEKFEAEFQPGSGSVDGLFGLAASKSFGGWSLHANILYLLVNKGTQNTDLGDRLFYNVAVAWRAYGGMNENGVISGDLAIDAVLELNGEREARQRAGGEKDPNSGGNVIYLSPGLRAVWRGTAATLSFGVPVVRDLNGLQSKPQWRLFTGLSTSF